MKKLILTTTLIFILFSSYSNNLGWRFGLKAAPSLSWIQPETRHYTHEENTFGFSYGILGDKFFSENYAISSGLFVTHHGGKIGFPENTQIEIDDINHESRTFDLQYIDIPLTLKMLTTEFGYTSFYGQFGVSGGINIRSRADGMADGEKYEALDIMDEMKRARFSLIMGAGLEYSLIGNTAIMFGIYYNNGFSNIIDNDDYSALASFVELTVGIIF